VIITNVIGLNVWPFVSSMQVWGLLRVNLLKGYISNFVKDH